ncbi:MAG: prepilin-type N-terminal cleavage/methylation domain-containing protein [Gemmataceae bacterium]
MIQRGRPTRRPGYTFIELMMVVAIIALLVALLLGGINKVVQLQSRTETTSDIMQMAKSLQVAKIEYNHVEYLPSRLRLWKDSAKYTDPAADAVTKATANVLRSMFGKRIFHVANNVSNKFAGWGVPDGTELKGAECLVFYLGGMPDTVNKKCNGFSTDALDPTKVGGERKGPYYAFKSSRLVTGPSGTYFMYLDPYGSPYAYFGAYTAGEYAPTAIYGASQVNTDNSNLGLTDAYFDTASPKRWMSPNTFQIISAGRNKAFGSGGKVIVSTNSPGRTDEDSSDNLTNFSQTELGNPIE